MTFSAEAGAATPLVIGGFVGALAVAYALTPIVRRWARVLGVVDRPDFRRVNTRPVPRGGGIAVAGAFLPVAAIVLVVNNLPAGKIVEQPAAIGTGQLVALLGGGIAAVLLGVLDDYFQLRARWQLLGQLALVVIAIAFGIQISTLNNPLSADGVFRLQGVVGVAFTAFWIVGMINSINWIDGLDGLSSGIAVIAAVTLGIISLTVEISQPFVAILCFVLAGALLGFLRWNFFPASVFVGTSGVMFVGYTLAVLSILGTAKVAVALLVLGVPILDTFWIIVRRVASGRSPFSPDRGHIHHRLLDLGLSHVTTVLVIYAICIGLAALSLVLSGRGQLYAFLGVVVGFGLLLLFLTRRSLDLDDEEELSGDEIDAVAAAPGDLSSPSRPDAAVAAGPEGGPAAPGTIGTAPPGGTRAHKGDSRSR